MFTRLLLVSLLVFVSCIYINSDRQQALYNKLPSNLQQQTSPEYICQELQPPTTIEFQNLVHRYERLKQIGKGGQAVVYKAMDHCTNSVVAVKVFYDGKVGQQEYQSLQQVQGVRGCIQARSQIIKDGVFYLVLDFYDTDVVGLVYSQSVKQRYVNLPDIQLITREVSHCLVYISDKLKAQQNDVKPDNILLKYRKGTQEIEAAVIADFGAVALIGEVGKTQTTHFMAPERLEASGVSHYNSDAYSMAVTVFSMFNHSILFNYQSRQQVSLAQYTLDLSILDQYYEDEALEDAFEKFGHGHWGRSGFTNIFQKYFRPLELLTNRQNSEAGSMFSYLKQSLLWDPEKRLPLSQALKHEFLEYKGEQ